MIRRLRVCYEAREGSAALEFAIIASFMLVFMLGLIEFGRMAWVLQTLQVVSQQTARCVAIGSGACSTPSSYAVSLAGTYGVTIDSSNISIATASASTASTCTPPNGNTMVQVTINLAFVSPVSGLVKGLSQSLASVACYPLTGM